MLIRVIPLELVPVIVHRGVYDADDILLRNVKVLSGLNERRIECLIGYAIDTFGSFSLLVYGIKVILLGPEIVFWTIFGVKHSIDLLKIGVIMMHSSITKAYLV